ncbi:MAG TPA: hypothetical protein VGI76_01460 [Solirubrobacteraceae bacterium]|jgi:hypothetical protein
MAHTPKALLSFLAAAGLTLLLPTGSLATLAEVGVIPDTTPPTTPSCPTSPCLALTRTTGFQVKVGKTRSLVTVPHEGSVVAWTVQLGKPNATQIKFFDTNEGGTASAAIAILRQQRKPNLAYKLIAQSPVVQLEKYFGKAAQFPLASTISVKKGDIIALAVPTWAPVLALGFTNETSWRASRPRASCSSTSTQSVQSVGATVQYYCLYRQARLTYSATLISTP